ncbi:MAG: aryl-sulfate sulfotransferase, partial [Candidatus Acidiferrales bacterium]
QAIASANIPPVTVTEVPGSTPQSGIELLDLIDENRPASTLAALDLSGNLLWSYSPPISLHDSLQGPHLLPNGHFLVAISPGLPGGVNVLREIDLAGSTIQEESMDQLNAALAKAGYNLTLLTFHHDVIAIPNGHWIALADTAQPCTGRPDCASNPIIYGDVLVDLAPNADGTFLPVWVWNAFNHLDVNRAPIFISDWTHSNAVLYSPDDGDLLLSIRHQSWIIKIDYRNGHGTGDVVWRLGYQGDFTLEGGTDPTDWFYYQHGPSFTSFNTSGKFSLGVMDNGDYRVFPPGVECGSAGSPPCQYSSISIYEIDESARTATLAAQYLPSEFSAWGGQAQKLANGNIEGDFTAGAPGFFSDILEFIPGEPPQMVWRLRTTSEYAYRGFRLPSLYPGVQW